MSIIRIDATKNAAQISFRTGQLSLSEKKTTLPPPPDTHAAHQLRLMVFNTRATCYLIPVTGLRTEVAVKRGQSILQCPAKLTRVKLHKRASRKDLPCSYLPAVRTCLFSYVRAVSQAVPGWSTARNFLALRGQRDFITLRFLCDLYVSSWKVWNQTRDDSTYCWKTTQRVVSTFHPTRLYCFGFAPSFFVFIRHTSLSSMYILRWIRQWCVLNSNLNPGEVQLYKSAEIRNQSDECIFY